MSNDKIKKYTQFDISPKTQYQKQEILNPFVGPRSFKRNAEEQQLFFGRKYETERIISLIYAHKLVLVYAQSGAGKTSIFNASIIPELEKMGIDVLPVARVGIGSNYIIDNESNKSKKFLDVNINSLDTDTNTESNYMINPYVSNTLQSLSPKQSYSLPSISTTLSQFLLNNFPHRTDKKRSRPIPQVLVFDQLEELFNLYVDPNNWHKQQEDFFKQIADALEKDALLRIVFIIREDYLAQLDPFSEIMPEKLKPRFRLERLHKDAVLEAIKGPLERSKGFVEKGIIDKLFDQGIIDKLIDDLLKIHVETYSGKYKEIKGDFVEPIQLQVVCQRLWRKLLYASGDNININNFGYFGDVDNALKDFYGNAVYEASKRTRINENIIRKWFEEKLITSSGTRSVIHRSSESTGGLDNKVVNILENKYLIRKEERSGAQWYELTHDRLIKPIQDSNKKWFENKRKSRNSFFLKVILPLSIVGIILTVIFTVQMYDQYVIDSSIKDGKFLEKAGNYIASSISFHKALAIDRNNKEALTGNSNALSELGKTLEKIRNYTGAYHYFTEALSNDSNNANALTGKGLVLFYDKHDALDAIYYFNKALELNETNIEALTGKGNALLYLDDSLGSRKAFDKALTIDPTNLDTILSKINEYWYMPKNSQQYINYIVKDLLLYHVSPTLLNALRGYLGNFNSNTSKIQSFQYDNASYYNNKNDTEALDGLGEHFNSNAYRNATLSLIYYNKALTINPNDKRALDGKGNTIKNVYRCATNINKNKCNESIYYYDKALSVDPHYSFALTDKASILKARGNCSEAKKIYEYDLANDPTDDRAFKPLKHILEKEGNLTALNYYTKRHDEINRQKY